VLNPKENIETGTNVSRESTAASKKTYRLPKLEWKKFGGDPKEGLGFWSQFQSIYQDESMAPQDKFQYLVQATLEKSKARMVVESFPVSAANYPKVIDYLKKRFEKDEVVVEGYTRELLRLVLEKESDNQKSIATLLDQLELRALESLGVKTESTIAIFYPLMESALPEETLRAWERRRSYSDEDEEAKCKLTRLMEFLRSEVESESRISLAKKGFTDQKESALRASRTQDEPSRATANDLFNKDDRRPKCIFCSKVGHQSSDFYQALRMTLEQKNTIIKEKLACFFCLQTGHVAKFCKWKPMCHMCDKPHFVLMCPLSPKNQDEGGGAVDSRGDSGASADPSTSSGGGGGSENLACYTFSRVLLETMEVELIGPKQRASVRLFIDTGSDHS